MLPRVRNYVARPQDHVIYKLVPSPLSTENRAQDLRPIDSAVSYLKRDRYNRSICAALQAPNNKRVAKGTLVRSLSSETITYIRGSLSSGSITHWKNDF